MGGYADCWMDGVGPRPASERDYQMVEDVERLCKVRRIKLDIYLLRVWITFRLMT
jgi:hypothetical protein